MPAGIKGMSWGWQSVTILCHKTCPLACLLRAQPSLQKRRKGFLFAFRFSAVRAAQGSRGGGRGVPSTVSEELRLQPFSSRARTAPCGNALAFLPPRSHPSPPWSTQRRHVQWGCRVGTLWWRALSLIPRHSLIPTLQSLVVSSRKHLSDEI